MSTKMYSLKISPQGQLTLPRQLREQLKLLAGERVAVSVADDGRLVLDPTPPIAAHFGTMPKLWTGGSQDAAEYTRALRDSMQPKRGL